MSLYSLDKLHLPSHGRGKPCRQPTWRVVGWGTMRDFVRKKDALAYINEQRAAIDRARSQGEGTTE